MQYLLSKIKEIQSPSIENLADDELAAIIIRTTLVLQNFVYWEALILRKDSTPSSIKDILLHDIAEEIANLETWTHATLWEKLRDECEDRVHWEELKTLYTEVASISVSIIDMIQSHWFAFWFSFLATLENYNSMTLLASIAKRLWLIQTDYISIHMEVDHSEVGHADIFRNELQKVIEWYEEDYKKGVDFATKIIRFRLWDVC